MMKAAPAPSFIMIEPQFLLEVLVIPLNSPAQHVNQIDQGSRRRQGREPVLARLLVALRPLDQQPLLRMRLGPPVVAMGGAHPQRSARSGHLGCPRANSPSARHSAAG
jgi:hypothetical protein